MTAALFEVPFFPFPYMTKKLIFTERKRRSHIQHLQNTMTSLSS